MNSRELKIYLPPALEAILVNAKPPKQSMSSFCTFLLTQALMLRGAQTPAVALTRPEPPQIPDVMFPHGLPKEDEDGVDI